MINVERLPVDICEVCGEDIVVAVDENGWPMLENAAEFMDDHAHCLRQTSLMEGFVET